MAPKNQKKKPQTRKKPAPKAAPAETFSLQKTIAFFRDERVRLVLAFFMLLFSVFLVVAFVSFFFTWKADQANLNDGGIDLLASPELDADNWAGKSGAAISKFFIHDLFGIPSFILVFLSFVSSLRLVNIRLVNYRRAWLHSMLILLWSSITFGFLFGDFWDGNVGGYYGYEMSRSIRASLGVLGTTLLLLSALAAYILINFEQARKWAKTKGGQAKAKVLGKIIDDEPRIELKSDVFPDYPDNTSVEPVQTTIKEEYVITGDGHTLLSEPEFEVVSTVSTPPPGEQNEPIDQKQAGQEEKDAPPIAYNNKSAPPVISESVFPDADQPTEPERLPDLFEAALPDTKKIEEEPIYQSDKLAMKVEKNTDVRVEPQTHFHVNENYDPTLDLPDYMLPHIGLLDDYAAGQVEVSKEELISNKDRIVSTLRNYKIEITQIKATIGPTVTLYEIVPAPGIRISKIKNLEDDIALSLSALGIRIIAPMPGRGTIGIEVPNQNPAVVSMKSVIASAKYQKTSSALPIALGKTISNETFVADLAKMPHLLVAGATGQGKSVGLNAIIASLLYRKHPAELKFVLIDPKKVELSIYEKIEKHYLAKLPDSDEAIITDNQKVIYTLKSLNREMEMRYDLLKNAEVRNIQEYNKKFIARRLNPEKGHHFMPFIVVIIDEFADLIMTAGKEVEMPIARIAQLARAVGIHMVIATQRPSTNIITGVIKANFPSRVAFKVASMIDSRTILDSPGANQLIGRGDMLITQGSDLVRLQCAFIDTHEIERITDYISNQKGYPTAFYLPEVEEEGDELKSIDLSKKDELFNEAARIVVVSQQGSTSLIQRKLSIGYNRAGRIMDQLEAAGIVGPAVGSKPRDVFYTDEMSLEHFLKSMAV